MSSEKRSKAIAEFKERVANPQWTLIPDFPDYEQNLFGHIREADTKNRVQPHVINKERRSEGMFVDLMRGGKTHIVNMDDIYKATFGKVR